MKDRKIKWLAYTVLVGMVPVISRILIYLVLRNPSISIFNTSDFVTFGLVLNISNINEIEHLNKLDKSWRTLQNGIALAFISFFMVLFSVYIVGESAPSLVNINAIKIMAMVLSLVSLVLSISVYDRVSKIS